jgi:hypothetical protein
MNDGKKMKVIFVEDVETSEVWLLFSSNT